MSTISYDESLNGYREIGSNKISYDESLSGYSKIGEVPEEVSQSKNIGALGPIPFYVSSQAVQTIRNVTWSGSGIYASHNRIGYTTLVEATGSDADTISFDMLLSADLGVNPWDAIKALVQAERNQTAMQLTIGDHGYGRYRWLVTSHNIKLDKFDVNGNLTEAVVSVKLVEYLKE